MVGVFIIGLFFHIPIILLICLIWHLILARKKLKINYYKLTGYALLFSTVLNIGFFFTLIRGNLNLKGAEFIVIPFLYLSLIIGPVFLAYKLLKTHPIKGNVS